MKVGDILDSMLCNCDVKVVNYYTNCNIINMKTWIHIV